MLHAAQASRIADFLGLALEGPDTRVERLDSFPAKAPRSLSFCAREFDVVPVAPDHALAITLAAVAPQLRDVGYSVIASDHPKFDTACAVRALMAPVAPPAIHPSAVIEPDVVLGDDVSIGPGCVLRGSITLGDGCRLGANNILANDVVLGSGVRLFNGVVIGEEAYSFGFGPDGESGRFPATGGVRIGDGVEIGNNVMIARGLLGETVLAEKCRIGDLAMIGNTVTVGRNSLVMSLCGVAASVTIGEGCWIGQGANLLQNIRIGDGAQVGMGAVVLDDVPADKVALGVPARVVRTR